MYNVKRNLYTIDKLKLDVKLCLEKIYFVIKFNTVSISEKSFTKLSTESKFKSYFGLVARHYGSSHVDWCQALVGFQCHSDSYTIKPNRDGLGIDLTTKAFSSQQYFISVAPLYLNSLTGKRFELTTSEYTIVL